MDGLAAARARRPGRRAQPKLRPRQAELARQMYDQVGDNGKSRWTVAQIAEEFGVTRPTIYRYLDDPAPAAGSKTLGRLEGRPADHNDGRHTATPTCSWAMARRG